MNLQIITPKSLVFLLQRLKMTGKLPSSDVDLEVLCLQEGEHAIDIKRFS